VENNLYIHLNFSRDRVPTVLLKEWNLHYQHFNGDAILGPVPTLFSENVEVRTEKKKKFTKEINIQNNSN
jgi:hypothetical protein